MEFVLAFYFRLGHALRQHLRVANAPGYAPDAEGIFVQLLLSGTKIMDTRLVNSGFSYFGAVSEFVETG